MCVLINVEVSSSHGASTWMGYAGSPFSGSLVCSFLLLDQSQQIFLLCVQQSVLWKSDSFLACFSIPAPLKLISAVLSHYPLGLLQWCHVPWCHAMLAFLPNWKLAEHYLIFIYYLSIYLWRNVVLLDQSKLYFCIGLIIELLRLKKTSRIIWSNCQPSTNVAC